MLVHAIWFAQRKRLQSEQRSVPRPLFAGTNCLQRVCAEKYAQGGIVGCQDHAYLYILYDAIS